MSSTSDALSGFIVAGKPVGAQSTDMVRAARRSLGERRVGHCGTLDPLAAGVLPLAIGRATRLSEHVLRAPKTYVAAVLFGVQTTTDDLEGVVIDGPHPAPDAADVLGLLPRFVGELRQRPPATSAVRVDGRRGYARVRAGEDFVLPERKVVVHAITPVAQAAVVIEVRGDRLALDGAGTGQAALVIALEVQCGRGTYIRSLARDIGAALGCGATLLALVRTAVGPFALAGAIGLEALRQALPADLADILYAPDVALSDLPACIVAAKDRDDFVHGRHLGVESEQSGDHRFYDAAGVFLGVAERTGGSWGKLRVMLAAA